MSLYRVPGPGLIARDKKVNETSCPLGTPQFYCINRNSLRFQL